jgi:hypothetical protein
VHQVPGRRYGARGARVRLALGRGDRGRATAPRGGDGRRGARDPQRPLAAARADGRARAGADPVAHAVDRGALHALDRRGAGRGAGPARILEGVPRARRLVRRVPALQSRKSKGDCPL